MPSIPTSTSPSSRTGLRDQESVHRENGRLNYTGDLDFSAVIDPSLVHQAAASVK